MTHTMAWVTTTMHHRPRRALAWLLRVLAEWFDATASRVEPRAVSRAGAVPTTTTTAARAAGSTVEFHTFEMGGRMVGGYYVGGELVAVVPDVVRL